MDTIEAVPLRPAAPFAQSVMRACARIAPTWPLDQMIAVNPYWGFVDHSIRDAATALGALSGARMLMPRAFYQEQWRGGQIRREHLEAALAAMSAARSVEQLVAGLQAPVPETRPAVLVTDIADALQDRRLAMTWRDFVVHQISQSCASYFDRSQAIWPGEHRDGLYASWKRLAAADQAPRFLMGHAGIRARLAALPDTPQGLLSAAPPALGLADAGVDDYFTALLLSVNGWAAWCAYERWQANFAQRDDDHLMQLLAIRLAWDWVLYDAACPAASRQHWAGAWRQHGQRVDAQAATDADSWIWQTALELAYQQPLCADLLRAPMPAASTGLPSVQAVFCIDVRSEVLRRALEAVSPATQTIGFAGFFGLPIAYRPIGTDWVRPQLPGLLSPQWEATDAASASAAEPYLGERVAQQRGRALQRSVQWRALRHTAGSIFSFVESCGLLYAGKLLADSGAGPTLSAPIDSTGLSPQQVDALRPSLPAAVSDADHQAYADLAAGILTAMGLTAGFARLVLLAGHGSECTNNPHAAALDCGACGGQSGEVNARVLAGLLNDVGTRDRLRGRGIDIAACTWFIAGVHNTTTDEVRLFDVERLPASHAHDLRQLRSALERAGDAARAERAPALDLDRGADAATDSPAALRRALIARAQDWAQVRPEWGLAGNAAFIVAPRARSRHCKLAGRTFLHDYDWRSDKDFATLELIMTAPMVVAQWISMQYYASTVDPQRYGSGNKVLHNIVGGRLGVFEGNGGDLRIGLPLQSLHDGQRWRHMPLRLSVLIEAPAAAIDGVIAKHQSVRQLVDNGWLHLFRIDAAADRIERRDDDVWRPFATRADLS